MYCHYNSIVSISSWSFGPVHWQWQWEVPTFHNGDSYLAISKSLLAVTAFKSITEQEIKREVEKILNKSARYRTCKEITYLVWCWWALFREELQLVKPLRLQRLTLANSIDNLGRLRGATISILAPRGPGATSLKIRGRVVRARPRGGLQGKAEGRDTSQGGRFLGWPDWKKL